MKHLISSYTRSAVQAIVRRHPYIKEMNNAKHYARTVGHRAAAGYLRNRGWSLEAAVWILFRKAARS
jgi:hypothetical protein